MLYTEWKPKKLEENVASLLANAVLDKIQTTTEIKEIQSNVGMIENRLGAKIDRLAVSYNRIFTSKLPLKWRFRKISMGLTHTPHPAKNISILAIETMANSRFGQMQHFMLLKWSANSMRVVVQLWWSQSNGLKMVSLFHLLKTKDARKRIVLLTILNIQLQTIKSR